MVKKILRNYQKNLLEVIFLIIGYVIGILSLSIGISVIKDSIEYNLDSTSGYVKNNTIVFVDFKENHLDLGKNIDSIINKSTNIGEVQVINLDPINVNNSNIEATPVLTIFKEDSNWHIPIIKGDFFNKEQFKNNENVVIIGKELATELFPNNINENSTIEILNNTYKVIGVCGRENRETQWDNVIYIPYNKNSDIINSNQRKTGQFTMFLRSNNTDRDYIENEVNNIFNNELSDINSEYNIEFDHLDEKDKSNIFNSILGTMFIAGTILVIVVINVVNISKFWIFNRRKEICIKKLLGELDKNIILSITIENSIIATFSMCIALIFQYILAISFKSVLYENGFSLMPSLTNILSSLFISCVCGIISALTPIREMIKMQPIEALHNI